MLDLTARIELDAAQAEPDAWVCPTCGGRGIYRLPDSSPHGSGVYVPCGCKKKPIGSMSDEDIRWHTEEEHWKLSPCGCVGEPFNGMVCIRDETWDGQAEWVWCRCPNGTARHADFLREYDARFPEPMDPAWIDGDPAEVVF